MKVIFKNSFQVSFDKRYLTEVEKENIVSSKRIDGSFKDGLPGLSQFLAANPSKNDGKCFLCHLKNSFCLYDI